MKKLFQCIVYLLFLSSYASLAHAGVSLSQTRLVIEQKDNQGSIVARNSDSFPYLVVSYMTKNVSDITSMKDTFIITPGVFRLEGDSQNTIKVQVISNHLPKDRESLFYLHSRNIPTTDKGATGIQVGLENIIKVFYRPTGLAISSKTAFAKLTLQPIDRGIRVSNPTPYYINLYTIRLNGKNIPISMKTNNNLIAPFGYVDYSTADKQGKFEWSVINELGGSDAFSQLF